MVTLSFKHQNVGLNVFIYETDWCFKHLNYNTYGT